MFITWGNSDSGDSGSFSLNFGWGGTIAWSDNSSSWDSWSTSWQAGTVSLTAGPDTIGSAWGDVTIVATTGTLSAGDVIQPAGWNNTLLLSGPGSFDLSLPTTISNIRQVSGDSGANQTITLGNASVTLTLGSGQNLVTGGAADLFLTATGGTATITAGTAQTTIYAGPGTVNITAAATGSLVVHGGSGTVNLSGGAENETIVVGSGRTVATLSTGHDIIQLGYAQGTAQVTGFVHGTDLIEISRFHIHDFASLQSHSTLTATATGVTLQITDGPTLTLVGVTSLAATDFVF